ncbi:MAG: prephenate dehydrogenase [Omnitrophica bacterium]|nr:prephenate dehydrogenase [Candidatus Omnitrophota bacterium]
MKFNKIAIIGVGLIGGSIGLAVKKKRLAKEIVGVCRHRKSLRQAKRIKAIDRGALSCKEAIKEADLVILATPISQIIKIAREIAPYLKKGCLVTDTGSTKSEIVGEIEKVFSEDIAFVGAHPLAGSEKRGVSEARANLFKDTLCILTQTRKTKLAAFKKINTFWQVIGCHVIKLTPQRHDQIVAVISHLPHLAAAQLVKVGRKNLNFAASGFRDTTRIASSDAEVWSDICLTNKEFIIQAIDQYITRLKLMQKLIYQEDKQRLSVEFRTAKTLRDGLQK